MFVRTSGHGPVKLLLLRERAEISVLGVSDSEDPTERIETCTFARKSAHIAASQVTIFNGLEVLDNALVMVQGLELGTSFPTDFR